MVNVFKKLKHKKYPSLKEMTPLNDWIWCNHARLLSSTNLINKHSQSTNFLGRREVFDCENKNTNNQIIFPEESESSNQEKLYTIKIIHPSSSSWQMQKNRLSSVECDDNPLAHTDLQTFLSSKKSVKPNIIHRHSSSLYTKTSPSSSLSTSGTSSNTPIAFITSNKSAVNTITGQSPLKNERMTQSTVAEILPQRLPLIFSPQRSSQLTVKEHKNTLLLPNHKPQLLLNIQNKPQEQQEASQEHTQTEMSSPNKRVTHCLNQDIINWICGDSKLNFDQVIQQPSIEKNKNRNASVPIEVAKIITESTIPQARISKNILRNTHNEEAIDITASNSSRIRRSRKGLQNESQEEGDKEKQLARFAESKQEKTETKEGQSSPAFESVNVANKKPMLFERLPYISTASKTSEKQQQFEQLPILNKSSLHSKISAVHDKKTTEDNNNKQILQSQQPTSSKGQTDNEVKIKQEQLGKFETSRIAKTTIKQDMINTENVNNDLMKKINLIGRRSSDGYQVLQNSPQIILAENSSNTKIKEKASSVHLRNSSLQDEFISEDASSSLHLPNQLLGKNGMRADLNRNRNYSSYSYLPLPAQIQQTQSSNSNTQSQSPIVTKHNSQFNYPSFKRIEKSSNPLSNEIIPINPLNSSSQSTNNSINNQPNMLFNFQIANSPNPSRKNRELLPSIHLSDKQGSLLSDPKDSLSPTQSLKKNNLGLSSPNKPIQLIPTISSTQSAEPPTPENQQKSTDKESSFSSAMLLQSPHLTSSYRQILLKKFNRLETINQNNSQNLSSSSLSPNNNNNNNSNQSFQEILSDKFQHLKSIEKVINSNHSHLLNLQQITSVIGTPGQQQQQQFQDQQPSTLKYMPVVLKNNSAINLGKQGYSASKIMGESRGSEITLNKKNIIEKNEKPKEIISEEKMQEDEWNFDAKSDSPVVSNQLGLKSHKIIKSILKNSKNQQQLSESNSLSPTFQRSPRKVQFI